MRIFIDWALFMYRIWMRKRKRPLKESSVVTEAIWIGEVLSAYCAESLPLTHNNQ